MIRAVLYSSIAIAFLSSAAAALAADRAPAASAALPTLDAAGLLAREAGEPPRGGNNERPGDRQRRGGKKAYEWSEQMMARRGADDPREPEPEPEDPGYASVIRT